VSPPEPEAQATTQIFGIIFSGAKYFRIINLSEQHNIFL